MYTWLWRRLPGHWSVRVLIVAALLAAVVVLLFALVFPAVNNHLPWNHVTVDDQGAANGLAGLARLAS